MQTDLTTSKLLGDFEEAATRWISATETNDFILASTIAADMLLSIRQADGSENPMVLSCRYGGRLFFHALRGISHCERIIQVDHWLRYPKAVEFVWATAHDSITRLERGNLSVNETFLESALERLKNVLRSIDNYYGPGIYTSPELLHSALNCSICGRDTRGCDHEVGFWYDGRRCSVTPVISEALCLAIVDCPVDPRCRIWPWLRRRTEGEHFVIEGVPILCTFSLEGDDAALDIPFEMGPLFNLIIRTDMDTDSSLCSGVK